MGEQLEGRLNTEEIKSIKKGNPLEKICNSFRISLTALLLFTFVGCAYNREKQHNQPQNLSQNPSSSNSLPQSLPSTKTTDKFGNKRPVISWVTNAGFINRDRYIGSKECFIETMPLLPSYKKIPSYKGQATRLPMPHNLLLQYIDWYSFSQDEKTLYLKCLAILKGTETNNFGKDFSYKNYPAKNIIYPEDVYEINLETGEFKRITYAQELITAKINEANEEQKSKTKKSLTVNQKGQITSEYGIRHPSINGEKIVYQWYDGIYLQDPIIGCEPKKLFEGRDPSWCGNEMIIHVDPSCNKIMKTSIDGKTSGIIADFSSSDKIDGVYSPKCSLDGNRVVFTFRKRGRDCFGSMNIGSIHYNTNEKRWMKYIEVTDGKRGEYYNHPFLVGEIIVYEALVYTKLRESPFKTRNMRDCEIFIQSN